MKYFAIAVVVLALSVCPMALHASIWHTTQPKATHHDVVQHPRTRHYTQKASKHKVVQTHVRHYTRKAHEDKSVRHIHKKHKKVGH